MPETATYTCEVCGEDVSDAALPSAPQFCRILVTGITVATVGDDGSVGQSAAGGLVFCTAGHAADWFNPPQPTVETADSAASVFPGMKR